MQISGKALLNSAENIIKERRQENQRSAGDGVGVGAKAGSTNSAEGLSQSSLESRLLKLQADLSGVQREYSREQSRSEYLNRNPEQISAALRFGEEPLFPELQDGQKPNLDALSKATADRMEHLMRSLKSVQVEMENLYALNFNGPSADSVDAARLLEQGGVKQLDPARVAHLTRS